MRLLETRITRIGTIRQYYHPRAGVVEYLTHESQPDVIYFRGRYQGAIPLTPYRPRPRKAKRPARAASGGTRAPTT